MITCASIVMHLAPYTAFLWYITIGLELILAALVLRRKTFDNFPFFVIYVLLSALRSISLWGVYRWAGYGSRMASDVFWVTEAMQLTCRVSVCAELCWKVLGKYPKLFRYLAIEVLVTTSAGVAVYTTVDSLRVILQVTHLVLALERGIEFAIAVVLISLLLIALRYGIVLQRAPMLLVSGLCFYSFVQVVDISFVRWLADNFPLWNDIRLVSFHVALLLWILALVKKDSVPDKRPVALSAQVYNRHVDIVARQLQELNEELEESIKA